MIPIKPAGKAEVTERKPVDGVVWGFLLLTYVHILISTAGYARFAQIDGYVAALFLACVCLTYALAYMLPVIAAYPLMKWILERKVVSDRFGEWKIRPHHLIYFFGVTGSTLLLNFIFVDQTVYRIFGFHLNGFVWNLVWTKGGIESMGATESTTISFVLISLTYLLIQTGLAAAVIKSARLRSALLRLRTTKTLIGTTVLFVTATVFQMLTCCVSSYVSYSPVLKACDVIPMYVPLRSKPISLFLGYKAERSNAVHIKSDSSRLHYPLHALQESPGAKHFNIVWLVAESLRGDMVDKEIMPATWSFAQRSSWYRNHYSGGNGTRMGMFSMFYGLYGPYWFKFISEQRGPVLIDQLIANKYQFDFRTSARFTYPEFDQTILARVPRECMHEATSKVGWESDRQHVTDMLKFIDRRDTARPFMSFIFFESPHLPYHFPPETIIRTQYERDLNYARINAATDIVPIKNRYVNSCNHLDSQIKRVLEHLQSHNLLDSTIVLITGDHGEEFMEKGRWGHGSAFSEEQTRPPLIIWAPGNVHQEVNRMTSHLDIPATVLGLLGVTNLSEDYSSGTSLSTGKPRQFTVVSDWNSINYVDAEYKALMPMQVWGSAMKKVTTRNDEDVPDTNLFFSTRKGNLLQIAHDLKRFNQ